MKPSQSRVATLALAVTSYCVDAHSQYTAPPPPAVIQPQPAPSHIAHGSQYYLSNLDGLRSHLEGLRQSEPGLYGRLHVRLASLETAQSTGTAIKWLSVLGGLTVFTLPLFGVGQEDCDQYDALSNESSNCIGANQSSGLTFFALGAAVGVGGYVVGAAMQPGRSEMLDYVNEHNRMRPNNPLRFQLGYSPKTRMARAGLRWQF